eukprot:UN30065
MKRVIGKDIEIPIIIKDVAGLVPGAYEGKGKGNAFLNDLCGADVLCHILDGSGQSDRSGNKGEKGDPVDDVWWVGEEIHRWIFDNVSSKWFSVLRKPEHLNELFTGYRATKDYIDETLSRMPDRPKTFWDWEAKHLHQLIAHFIAIRFPILLVMNKLDISTTQENIIRVKKAYPYQTVVSTSAHTEWLICQYKRNGDIKYTKGGNRLEWVKNDKIKKEIENLNEHFF